MDACLGHPLNKDNEKEQFINLRFLDDCNCYNIFLRIG